ncbi:hypothetical protein B566_EDAN000475 [Ephemera danica]|nr:hypothetical protein B566_EDAN000475 [Ephemera danica]
MEMVTDEEVVDGIKLLAQTEGIFAETAGGVTIGVLKKLVKQDRTGPRRPSQERLRCRSHRIERGGVRQPVYSQALTDTMELTELQIQRYSRHIILNEVGGKGQKKLAHAKVLLIGAGGLGSPAGLYLAAAGIGTIGLVDGDVVDLSNLQRQIMHSTATVGMPKVESGKKTLTAINPEITVNAYHQLVDADNILPLISQYDIVLDGSDNFSTRFLVNDACFFAKKTLISASMFRFEGQLTTIKPHAGYPCYRCLYPEPPPAGLVPNCQEAGVLGVLAGTMGILQASEAIKEVLGIGETIADKLVIYDALDMKFRKVSRPKDPACPLCGPQPKIKDLGMDYAVSCTI